MRPLFAAALAEHEALMLDSGATGLLRKNGWMKLYRSEEAFAALAPELDLAASFDIPFRPLDVDAALQLEPALFPEFRHAVFWPNAASVTDPYALTQAYLARFAGYRGAFVTGDAMTLHRHDRYWRVDTEEGPIDADEAIVALGPWAQDILVPLGIRLPLGFKRGYHLHFRPGGNAVPSRPVVDIENGFCIAPMEQGIRITTGVEFADRDAPPSPVQFDRLWPAASSLVSLGEAIEPEPWLGVRPCLPDSRPVIGPAPGQGGLWLAIGHAHWGLTLGPATGRLIADLVTGAEPFCDPAPYGADRFA